MLTKIELCLIYFGQKNFGLTNLRQNCTHVVSIFIANSCVIKQGITETYYPNHCHFMRFCGKFIFLHYLIIRINMTYL